MKSLDTVTFSESSIREMPLNTIREARLLSFDPDAQILSFYFPDVSVFAPNRYLVGLLPGDGSQKAFFERSYHARPGLQK